jgi:hypothetical protein
MEVKENITACKMNYTNNEYADTYLILGKVCGIQLKQNGSPNT